MQITDDGNTNETIEPEYTEEPQEPQEPQEKEVYDTEAN